MEEQNMSEIISKEFADKYKNKKVNWGFNGLGYIVYKRTYSRTKEDGNSEEWYETIRRCINGAQKIGAKYTKEEAERLYDYIFNLKGNFAGRFLWQLGTKTVDRLGLPSLQNCWATRLATVEDFCFMFDMLMLGGGVGYSVRREDVYELPKIKQNVNITHLNTKDADFILPDSREGWIELLKRVLNSFFHNGESFTYSTILIRGANEKINGFGGVASGPKPLIDGITNIASLFKSREGKKLRSIDVLDIANIIGSIVVSGNVRRSSQIALGDADDYLFLRAKRWDLGQIPNWRAMSNNTIVADSYDYTSDDLWEGFNKNGEPYGLFNLKLTQKYGRLIDGPMKGSKLYPQHADNAILTNPCIPSWTAILTKDGLKQLSNINIGDVIWSESGWTKVINKWSSGVKKVYEYKTTAGCFYGTENHKLVSNGEKIEAKDCDNVDILVGPYEKTVKFDIQDIMDGIVFGDGTVHKASNNLVHLIIGDNDNDYFSSEVAPLIKKYRPGLSERAYEVRTTITHNELPKTFLREIPERFIYNNKNKICGFLRGLYTANGSICGGRVTLKAASFNVIKQVQVMLSAVGIKSYYTTNKSTNIQFGNGEYTCKQSYDLNITSDKYKFYSIIGFIQKYKNEKLESILSDKINTGKINYDIISVDLVSEEEVFDITVDNSTHTLWNNGINISNCGEISLNDGEACCLSELYLNNIKSQEELIDLAKLLYKTQKAISGLASKYEKTNKIVSKNRRLGLGVTGVCQSLDKIEWLDECYKELRKFDKQWSKECNAHESIKLTTCKPSGSLSLLSNSMPGIHPGFAKYFIRRVRLAANDKLVEYCKSIGLKTEYQINFDKSIDHNTIIVEFPCQFEDSGIIAKNMTAIQQLEIVKKLQTYWSDNSVSCTVYYKIEELSEIKKWLSENYETCIKSVSFLLHSEHGFIQAPYEEITEEQYNSLLKNVKPIVQFNNFNEEILDGLECAGGACPVR